MIHSNKWYNLRCVYFFVFFVALESSKWYLILPNYDCTWRGRVEGGGVPWNSCKPVLSNVVFRRPPVLIRSLIIGLWSINNRASRTSNEHENDQTTQCEKNYQCWQKSHCWSRFGAFRSFDRPGAGWWTIVSFGTSRGAPNLENPVPGCPSQDKKKSEKKQNSTNFWSSEEVFRSALGTKRANFFGACASAASNFLSL